jgi:predicted nucleic acid-binding Zn finger protein
MDQLKNGQEPTHTIIYNFHPPANPAYLKIYAERTYLNVGRDTNGTTIIESVTLDGKEPCTHAEGRSFAVHNNILHFASIRVPSEPSPCKVTIPNKSWSESIKTRTSKQLQRSCAHTRYCKSKTNN